MADRSISILCTGDLHLGRHPSGVDTGDDRLSVTYVWNRIVDLAIEQDFDLVALTGDVVDRANRYYEAIGPLQRGIERLGAEGIRTFAVSGNHDWDVLPRLVDAVGGSDSFTLLGRLGTWEQEVVEFDDAAIRLVGWSYPGRYVRKSPLDSFALSGDDEIPTVGLLHADLDSSERRYAPVFLHEFEASAVDAWLLGHIHQFDLHRTDSDKPILYPGSPQPLDPTETGLRGPWGVEVDSAGNTEFYHHPAASLRYHQLDIDLDGVDDEEEFQRAVPEQINASLGEMEKGGDLDLVVYRLRYTGRTDLHRRLARVSENSRWTEKVVEDLSLSHGSVQSKIDRVEIDTAPKIDLERLAGGDDPSGVLAEIVLQARRGEFSNEGRDLMTTLEEKIGEIHGSPRFSPLLKDSETSASPDDEWIRRRVVVEGMALLDEMRAAKESE